VSVILATDHVIILFRTGTVLAVLFRQLRHSELAVKRGHMVLFVRDGWIAPVALLHAGHHRNCCLYMFQIKLFVGVSITLSIYVIEINDVMTIMITVHFCVSQYG
jgi:hypothetical protein